MSEGRKGIIALKQKSNTNTPTIKLHSFLKIPGFPILDLV
jgi:hypothetical protein